VLKDPLKPNSINPAYDNGDGIHANIAGQQAIADFISLPMLGPSTAH
jgi:lysophospholipase L1-like esterase